MREIGKRTSVMKSGLAKPSSYLLREHCGYLFRYYQAYISFFTEEVKAKGINAVLEEYVFATSANYVLGHTEQPQMLGRLLDGVVHPLIHVGYGVEFGLPGMVIEGNILLPAHQRSFLIS
jgi:hypothetical protein